MGSHRGWADGGGFEGTSLVNHNADGDLSLLDVSLVASIFVDVEQTAVRVHQVAEHVSELFTAHATVAKGHGHGVLGGDPESIEVRDSHQVEETDVSHCEGGECKHGGGIVTPARGPTVGWDDLILDVGLQNGSVLINLGKHKSDVNPAGVVKGSGIVSERVPGSGSRSGTSVSNDTGALNSDEGVVFVGGQGKSNTCGGGRIVEVDHGGESDISDRDQRSAS